MMPPKDDQNRTNQQERVQCNPSVHCAWTRVAGVGAYQLTGQKRRGGLIMAGVLFLIAVWSACWWN